MQIQAYGVGFDSSQRLAARQELTNQLQCPDEAVIPVCLVCEKPGDDAAEKDYDQFGSGEVSLQVTMLCNFQFSVMLSLFKIHDYTLPCLLCSAGSDSMLSNAYVCATCAAGNLGA